MIYQLIYCWEETFGYEHNLRLQKAVEFRWIYAWWLSGSTKWPRFSTLLIPFSSHKGVFRLRGKPLRSIWEIRTGFKRKPELRDWDLLTNTFYSFHWNPNRCLSRAGGNYVSTYLHSFAHKTTNMGDNIYGLNETDFKKVYCSCIFVLFWKRASNVFNSDNSHSLQVISRRTEVTSRRSAVFSG